MNKINISEINKMPEIRTKLPESEVRNEDRMPKVRKTYDILESLMLKGEQIEYRQNGN